MAASACVLSANWRGPNRPGDWTKSNKCWRCSIITWRRAKTTRQMDKRANTSRPRQFKPGKFLEAAVTHRSLGELAYE